jgi:hypothetical protein
MTMIIKMLLKNLYCYYIMVNSRTEYMKQYRQKNKEKLNNYHKNYYRNKNNINDDNENNENTTKENKENNEPKNKRKFEFTPARQAAFKKIQAAKKMQLMGLYEKEEEENENADNEVTDSELNFNENDDNNEDDNEDDNEEDENINKAAKEVEEENNQKINRGVASIKNDQNNEEMREYFETSNILEELKDTQEELKSTQELLEKTNELVKILNEELMNKHKTIKQMSKETERKKELDDYFHNNKHKFIDPNGELEEGEFSKEEFDELHEKFKNFEESILMYLNK